jgi:hypothetical protein
MEEKENVWPVPQRQPYQLSKDNLHKQGPHGPKYSISTVYYQISSTLH